MGARGICVAMVVLCTSWLADTAKLKVGFYKSTCPTVETVIRQAVYSGIASNPGIEGGVLRIHFHDCFVNGCDASVLIDAADNSSEKHAIPNVNLRGYEIIDSAKSAVESVCQGVVSCADVAAYAARDSVFLRGGYYYDVEAGRRDGLRSNLNDTSGRLPGFTWNVSQLTTLFASNNLTQDDMIILSGGHTIGSAHCSTINARLYSFNATVSQDPSIEPTYAKALKALCPQTNANASLLLNLDTTTPRQFDNAYYTNLLAGKGLLFSDQVLETDSTTRGKVQGYAANGCTFQKKFGLAMVQMGRASVLTGTQGQIRKNCRAFNPTSTLENVRQEPVKGVIQEIVSLVRGGEPLISKTVADFLNIAHNGGATDA